MLLIALWTMLLVSQAYAACCGSHGGMHHGSMLPVAEIHAIVQSEHEACNDPQEPYCPPIVDEQVPIASAQPSLVDDGRLAQAALVEHAPPMLFEAPRAGTDRIPDSPGPPDRVYLRLQRILI
jgi:hypothetical protein